MAVGGGTGVPTVAVGMVLDPAASQRLVTEITGAFTRAMNTAGAAFAKQMTDIGKNTAANIKILDDAVRKLNGSFGQAQTASHGFTTQTSKETIEVIRLLKLQNATQLEIAASLNKSSAVERQLHIASTSLANTEGRVQVEQIKNVGRVQFVEGQKNLIQVRENAKRRLLLTQQLFQHLVRLEKTVGTGIAGAARGLSAGFSKVFTTVKGLFTKNNEEITAGFRKNEQAVEQGLKRDNSAFNSGLGESLNKRERALQSSFTQQEQIVRRSVIRQEEQMTKLRTQTSHGVLGAVTGRGVGGGLGLGSLFGGLGVIGVLGSTFKVGSEFTKGLAVLQSQLNLTGEQMVSIRKLSIDLGNDISLPGVSALDAAEAIQILTKHFGALGPAAADAAQAAAKGTLQLSRAAGVGAEDAAQVIGSAINVFGIDAKKAVDVADTVAVALSKSAGVSFEDFKTSFLQGAGVFQQFIGPTAKAKDVLTDFSTALAVLAKSGQVGAFAGAGLKQFFLQGSRDTDKAKAATREITARAKVTGKIFFDADGKARRLDDSIDILRAGLKGMSDEQRNLTLSSLFGSRSIITANALLRSTSKEYDDLRASMERGGAAAQIAAAANTGLKGAFDALQSVIETVQIVFYEKVQKPLGQAVLWFANLANEILFSGGAWHYFRRAAIGAVAAIGTIIALKGAIETIKLLSTALTALTSPFGVILIVAGLVGAAIALMTDNTSKLGKSLRDLAAPLTEGFGRLIGAKGQTKEAIGAKGGEGAKQQAVTFIDIFTRLKFILTQDVIPAVRDAAAWVGDHLVAAFKIVYHFVADTLIPIISHFVGIIIRDLIGAFHATVRFIENVLIPGFKTVYHYIAETLIPKIVHIAGVIADAFVVAAHAVVDFWRMVKPYLDPLINGFSQLGKGVGAIFTGDFSHLGSGFVSAGKGIAGTVAKTASSIGDALHPIINQIGQFFTDLFSPSNIKKYIKGAFDFINTLGYILGRIVSDPRLLKTIAVVGAVLVAAAVKIAYQFITGFFRGVIENLPTLFAMASKVLEAGFKLAFANIGKILIAVVGILAFGPTLARLFHGAGASAGDGFFAGLKSKASNARGVLSGLFSTGGSLASTNARLGNANEITGLNNQLRVLGGKSPFLDVSAYPAQIKKVKEEIALLGGGITDAQLRGLKLKDTFTQAGVAARGIGSGLTQSVKALGTGTFGALTAGIKKAFAVTKVGAIPTTGFTVGSSGVVTATTTAGQTAGKAFTTAFRASLVGGKIQFTEGLKSAFGSLKEYAKSQGITTGQLIGRGIAIGASTALAIGGGFVAGKAEGERGGSGLTSALFSGLTATAMTAELGPVSIAIGVATTAASLLGAEFGRSEKKAKEFRAEVHRVADQLRGDFLDAVNAGKFGVGKVNFADVFSAGANADKLKQDFNDAFAKFTPDQAGLAASLKLNVGLDITPLVTMSNGDKQKFETDVKNLLADSVRNTPEFKSLFGDVAAADVVSALNKGLLTGSDAQKAYAANFLAIQKGIILTGDAAVDAGASVASLTDTLKAYNDSSRREHIGLENVSVRAATTGNFQRPAPPRVTTDPVAAASLAKLAEFVRAGQSVDEAQKTLAKLKFPSIQQNVVDAWVADFDHFQKEVQATKDALDGVPGKIAKAFGANEKVVAGAQLTIEVSDVAKQVQTALADPGALGQAQATVALKGVGEQFGAVIAQGITDGAIIDTTTAKFVMQPFIDEAIAALDPTQPGFEDAKKKLQETFAATLEGLQPTIDDAKTQIELQRVQGLMTQFWKDHPATSEARVKFFVTLGDTGQGVLNEGDFRKFGKVPSTVTSNIIDTLLPPTLPAQVQAKAKDSGIQVPKGLTAGMNDPDAIAAMKAQVVNLASQAIAQFRQTLGIKSPSKVFHGFGTYLAEGFANGIASGAEQVANGAARMAQSAVDAAHGVLHGNQLSFGGISPASYVGQQSAANNAVQTAATVAPTALHPDVAAGLASLKNRGPDVTNVSIVEAQNARSTGRAVITELRTQRMLLGHR